ncbi:peptide-methionine (S)-S-oxide reductase MsrA, partial [Campylobacter jejuni]|nr:peptide-methionine (S)-S-oxide reductase [Campylobacter jejuni]EHD2601627.1 peptide-methionine (S)-S-oxide reductase [Campylobacter jejuni]
YYKAENYHQHYFINNPDQGYCQAVIAPKLQKIQSD